MPETSLITPGMQAEIDKFVQASDEIVSSVRKELEAIQPPPLVYHYTNDRGLTGILESGKLWFTDAFNLNDPSELKYGFSHAGSLLNSMAATGNPATKRLAKDFEHLETHGGPQKFANHFICSFGSDGDELGQWRAYADIGQGYALGFDTKLLEDAFVKASEGEHERYFHTAFPVSYDDNRLADIHGRLIDKIVPLLALPHGDAPPYIQKLTLVLVARVAYSSLFHKHAAYKNEGEYRFLQTHRPGELSDVKFRSRPYSLVRYREFDWRSATPEALKRIVVGPAAHGAKACQLVRDCLRYFHPGDVRIERSKIPYRAA